MNLAQISLIVAILGVILSGLCVIYLRRLRRRVAKITPDTQALIQHLKARPVSKALNELFAHLESFSHRMTRLEAETAQLQRNYAATVQRVGLVRFNVDESIHGDLSFALALLEGDTLLELNGWQLTLDKV